MPYLRYGLLLYRLYGNVHCFLRSIFSCLSILKKGRENGVSLMLPSMIANNPLIAWRKSTGSRCRYTTKISPNIRIGQFRSACSSAASHCGETEVGTRSKSVALSWTSRVMASRDRCTVTGTKADTAPPNNCRHLRLKYFGQTRCSRQNTVALSPLVCCA